MAEENNSFTPIETQEEFNAAIKDRIDRVKNSVRDEFKDYEDFKAKAADYDKKTAEYETKISGFQKSISDKDTEIKSLKEKVAKYETDSVKTALVNEYHLDPDLKDFLIGDTEKDWRASAEKLASMTRRKYPEKNYSNSAGPCSLEKQLLRQLKGD